MGTVEKVHVIGALPMGESSQPEQDAEDRWTPEGAVPPPLDLDALAKLTTVARTRRSCIAAIVQNTVGLGLRVEVREGHEEEADEDTPALVLAELDALARRDKRLHRPNAKRLFQAVKWDEQEVGNGYLEVSRNRVTGRIDGLFHVPGKRLRRRSDRDGWVLVERSGFSDTKTRFYDFGEKVAYTDDGQPTGKLARNGRRWDVNEVIPFQLYTSESRDYGLPPDHQLSIDYLGDKLAGEANVGFFDSSGVPPTVIFVQGTESSDTGESERIRYEVDPSLVTQIADTMLVGKRRRSRVAIVPVPPGTEINREDLAVLSERDMGFVAYRADNRRATLGAFRLSPIFVADIEDAGKYTAEVERAITKEQVFDPEQDRWEDILSDTIVRELAGEAYRLAFTEIAIKGDEAVRDSANEGADRGAVTWGEFRRAHGYEPLPESDTPEPGQVETGFNAELMPPRTFTQARSQEQIEKSAASELVTHTREEFEAGIADAIGRVAELAGDSFDLAPVVVEKDGERIVVSPYAHAENGSG